MPRQITRRESEATGKVSWLVRVEVGKKADGKPKYMNKTFDRKKDAEAFRAKLLRDRRNNLVVEPSKMALGEYLDRWMEGAAKPRLRTVSYEGYERMLNLYIRPKLSSVCLNQINAMLLQRHYATLLDEGYSARTIRLTHAVVSSALKQAVKWRLLLFNPAIDVELPRQERKEMQVLTPEESFRFIVAARDDRLGALFELAISTGMRPGEYLGLKWRDIDLGEGVLSVRRTLVNRTNQGWLLTEPKTPRSRRTIPIPSGTMTALRLHKVQQAEIRLAAGPDWHDYGFVFTTRSGEPISRNNLTKRNFKNVLKNAELGTWVGEGEKKRFVPKIRLYDLRHTCATLLLADNVNPKVVSERLGHSSIVMTLDTYSHVLPNMQQDAADRLDKMLYGAGNR